MLWVSLAEEVVISAGHRTLVLGKVLAGVLPGGSLMEDSLNKPPGGKCVMVGRSLVRESQMFNPSDKDVLLWKNTMQQWCILWRWKIVLTTRITRRMTFGV